MEKKLNKMGFTKLLDKESYIYYELSIPLSHDESHQICIVFDKIRKNIKSLETFAVSGDRMKLLSAPLRRAQIDFAFSSLLSSKNLI